MKPKPSGLIRAWCYTRNVWEGSDHKPSIKRLLAIAFSIDFIQNFSHSVHRWSEGRSMDGLSLALGIEAGIICAMLGLTSYFSLQERKLNQESSEKGIPQNPPME